MKTLIGLSSFLSLLLLVALQASITSCNKDVVEKEVISYDTITVTKTDTIIKTDTLRITDTTVTPALLTSTTWKTDQIIGVNGNFLLVYERGASGNTENYDNEYMTFNTDGTGVFFDAANSTHAMIWHYTDSSYTRLAFDVYNPYPIPTQSVIWDNLRYKNGEMKYDQYWSYEYTNSHSQVIRSPK